MLVTATAKPDVLDELRTRFGVFDDDCVFLTSPYRPK